MNVIGKLNRAILGKYKNIIISEDVIMTNERIEHTKSRHPGDYEKYIKYLPDIIRNPDYILEDIDNVDTILLLKTIEDMEKNIQVVIRLQTSKKDKNKNNSILSFWHCRNRCYKSVILNNIIIYQKNFKSRQT